MNISLNEKSKSAGSSFPYVYIPLELCLRHLLEYLAEQGRASLISHISFVLSFSNTIKSDRDGGDCCGASCVSTPSYPCGYGGYDCLDPSYAGQPTPLPTLMPTLTPTTLTEVLAHERRVSPVLYKNGYSCSINVLHWYLS
jgi:hypothetical protein